jgi:hypothetical protein
VHDELTVVPEEHSTALPSSSPRMQAVNESVPAYAHKEVPRGAVFSIQVE